MCAPLAIKLLFRFREPAISCLPLQASRTTFRYSAQEILKKMLACGGCSQGRPLEKMYFLNQEGSHAEVCNLRRRYSNQRKR